jgi:hypothetical protein
LVFFFRDYNRSRSQAQKLRVFFPTHISSILAPIQSKILTRGRTPRACSFESAWCSLPRDQNRLAFAVSDLDLDMHIILLSAAKARDIHHEDH